MQVIRRSDTRCSCSADPSPREMTNVLKMLSRRRRARGMQKAFAMFLQSQSEFVFDRIH